MIKALTNIILIQVVLLSQLYNSFVVASYEINYDYYAEELCENTDKPDLHCDGKCFFSKQLALDQDRKKETEAPTMLPSLRLFQLSVYYTYIDVPAFILEPGYTIKNLPLPRDFKISGIYHPPRS